MAGMLVRDIFIRLGLQDGGVAAKLAQAGRAGDALVERFQATTESGGSVAKVFTDIDRAARDITIRARMGSGAVGDLAVAFARLGDRVRDSLPLLARAGPQLARLGTVAMAAAAASVFAFGKEERALQELSKTLTVNRQQWDDLNGVLSIASERAGVTSGQLAGTLTETIQEMGNPLSRIGSRLESVFGIDVKKMPISQSLPLLRQELLKLTPEKREGLLRQLFGEDAEAMEELLVRLSDEDFAKFARSLENTGEKTRFVIQREDTLMFKLQKLGASVTKLAAGVGGVLAPTLGRLVDALTGVISWVNDQPLLKFVAAIGLTAIATAFLAAKIVAVWPILTGFIGTLATGTGAALAFGGALYAALAPVAVPLLAIIAAFLALNAALKHFTGTGIFGWLGRIVDLFVHWDETVQRIVSGIDRLRSLSLQDILQPSSGALVLANTPGAFSQGGTISNRTVSIGRIEVSGVKDPEKVAEAVLRRIRNQFEAAG